MSTKNSMPGHSILNKINSRRGKITIGLIAVVIIVVAFTAYTFFIDKTPKEKLIHAESENMAAIAERWENTWKEWNNLSNLIEATPYEIDSTVSGSIEDFDPARFQRELQMVHEVLEQGTLNINTAGDPQQGIINNSASLTVHGLKLLGFELNFTEKLIAFNCADFYDESLLIETAKLGETLQQTTPRLALPENIGIPILPSTENFVEIIEEQIKDDYVEYTPAAKHDSPMGEIKVDQLNFSMSPEESENFFRGLQKSFKDKEETQNLIELLSGMLKVFVMNYTDNENFHSIISSKEYDYLEGQDQLYFPHGIEMDIFVNEKGEIVDRELSFSLAADPAAENKGLTINYSSSNWEPAPHERNTQGKLEIKGGENNSALVFDYNWISASGEEGDKTNLYLKARRSQKSNEDNNPTELFSMEIERIQRTDPETDIDHYETDFDISFSADRGTETAPRVTQNTDKLETGMKGSMVQEINRNMPDTDYAMDNELDLKIYDKYFGWGEIHLLLNVNIKAQRVEETTVVKPDEDKAVNLSTIEKDEWKELTSNIKNNLRDYIDQFRFILQ